MSDGSNPDRTTAKFLRGLTIGALLGAVVAGSSIWSRRGSARRRDAMPDGGPPQPLTPGVAATPADPEPSSGRR